MRRSSIVLSFALFLVAAAGAQTFTNGPLITHLGGGFGGAHASALQQNLQMGLFGFTSSVVGVADDFTVPCGQQWAITSFTVYGYETQASGGPFTTTSPFGAGHYRIWNGHPGLASSSIIHNHSTPNQLTATGFTGIYRVPIGDLQNRQRPIHSVTLMGNGIVLGPGTYWLDYQIIGATTAFTPAVSILNNPQTGNATQYVPGAFAWCNVLTDAGFTQGIPFQVAYSSNTISCFALNITQLSAGMPVSLADTGGTPGNTFVNLISLNGVGYPNGWLFGINFSADELAFILSAGPPFTGTLDFSGNFILPGVVVPVPVSGLPVYFAGVELAGPNIIRVDGPKTMTIYP